MNTIDLIYCICLKERKNHMNNFFKKFNIKNFLYVDPILGSSYAHLSENDLIKQNILQKNNKLVRKNIIPYNKIAHTLTFIKTLKHFLTTKNDFCLILEDDLYIPKDYEINLINHRIKLLFNNINSNWQYVNLGRCFDKSCPKDKKYNINHFDIQHCLPVCTHAILIKRNIADYLIKNTLPIKEPTDNTWRKIIHQDSIYKKYSYCSVPAIFHQDRETLNTSLNTNILKECNGNKKNIKFNNNFIIKNHLYKILSILILIIFYTIFSSIFSKLS